MRGGSQVATLAGSLWLPERTSHRYRAPNVQLGLPFAEKDVLRRHRLPVTIGGMGKQLGRARVQQELVLFPAVRLCSQQRRVIALHTRDIVPDDLRCTIELECVDILIRHLDAVRVALDTLHPRPITARLSPRTRTTEHTHLN